MLFSSSNTTTENFQLDIIKLINERNIGKNINISPLSIFYILSLTTNGAANLTMKEMLKALGYVNKAQLNKRNEEISKIITDFKSVEMANSIFTKFNPEKKFIESAGQYKATIDKLLSAGQVNTWVRKATHNKIRSIVDKLNPLESMILINAIYFQGDWKYSFDIEKTKQSQFLNFNKNEIKTDFMNIDKEFQYYEDDTIQAVKLEYKKDNLYALIILPKIESDINNYIKGFTNATYLNILNKLNLDKVVLSLPIFKIEYNVDIKDILLSMGMKEAFSKTADFSVMKKEKDIYISKVQHKTYIYVDELGTTAAAETAFHTYYYGEMPQEPSYRMNVNKPFLFLISSKILPKGNDILFFSKIESI